MPNKSGSLKKHSIVSCFTFPVLVKLKTCWELWKGGESIFVNKIFLLHFRLVNIKNHRIKWVLLSPDSNSLSLPAGDWLWRPLGDPPQTGSGANCWGISNRGTPAPASKGGRLQGHTGTDAGAAGGEKGARLFCFWGPELGDPPDAPRGGQQRVWHHWPREAL